MVCLECLEDSLTLKLRNNKTQSIPIESFCLFVFPVYTVSGLCLAGSMVVEKLTATFSWRLLYAGHILSKS